MNDTEKAILYEENVSLEKSIRVDYLRYLKDQILETLQIQGFFDAEVLQEQEHNDGMFRISVRYAVRSEADLQQYLLKEGPRARAIAYRRFGDQFKVWRRVLTSVEQPLPKENPAKPAEQAPRQLQ
jgi:hypothetical protein